MCPPFSYPKNALCGEEVISVGDLRPTDLFCASPAVGEAPPTLVFERWVRDLIFRVLECIARQTIALLSCPSH